MLYGPVGARLSCAGPFLATAASGREATCLNPATSGHSLFPRADVRGNRIWMPIQPSALMALLADPIVSDGVGLFDYFTSHPTTRLSVDEGSIQLIVCVLLPERESMQLHRQR